jgi:hypothetical protein
LEEPRLEYVDGGQGTAVPFVQEVPAGQGVQPEEEGSVEYFPEGQMVHESAEVREKVEAGQGVTSELLQ